ncbi:hypothetical protein A3D78_03640 [Candidatus Gottesmanbacteria bacterium RIFCSPHIGHO2_02_FULL_39_14]|uniref:Uncharacterized protein n=1 Tax=Candidatus Gottesmanbacteria bacterium RIFCSPHIGHO2_02_FULL_39_14 TaxID=1798383 RepID=A0A1F5ZYJ7_9BACT|nr:MAG: hypothetical protein A3D78_03640 [Candidatus Gottesmanbacteria bacterium RIFCSPHIGHO2_02_FULL_39_14]
MPILNTKLPRYNSAGEAARREQMRNADLDRIEKNKKFPTFFVKQYGFRPYFSGHDVINIKGPLCPRYLTKERQCLAELSGEIISTKAHCEVCDGNFDMPHNFEDFRRLAHKAYQGYLNSQTQLITLDIPFEAIKAESEDETRKIKIVWSQKDGRNQAIIYLIRKDKTGAKSHIFADLDREEIRYDSSDIPPGEILAKIKTEFKTKNINIEFK